MAIPLFTKTFRTDGTASSTIQFDDWFTDERASKLLDAPIIGNLK